MTSLPQRTFALIHSPFLAPSVWRDVGDVLERSGERARLLDLSGGLKADGNFYRIFGELAADQIADRSVLVAHSGAGAVVPSVIHRAGGRVQGVIFVDGLLPHPSRCWMETAPVALAERLRATARNGRVPPWPTWLPEAVLAELLPDEPMRTRFVAGAPAVPLAFLEEPAPDLPLWAASCRAAYLQLSPNYDAEAREARALGWPVDRFDGRHLSMMNEPASIAEAILALAPVSSAG